MNSTHATQRRAGIKERNRTVTDSGLLRTVAAQLEGSLLLVAICISVVLLDVALR